MDQQEALRFIHQNVQVDFQEFAGAFAQSTSQESVWKPLQHLDGDPNRITIFDQSAGGEAVSYQMMHPKSIKYFTRAIVQSGPGPWNFNQAQVKPIVNQIVFDLCNSLTDCSAATGFYDILDRLTETLMVVNS